MSTELEPSNEALRAALALIAEGRTAADVLDALLAGASLAAARVSLFLVRRGRLRGHGGAGMSEDARQRIAKVDVALDAGLAAESSRHQSPWVVSGSDERWAELEQSQSSELAFAWIRLEGTPSALLVGARIPGGAPWSPPALAILAAHAQARLEVELAKKRVAAAAVQPVPVEAPPAPAAAAPQVDAAPAPAAAAARVDSPPAVPPPIAQAPRESFEFTVTVREPLTVTNTTETGLAPYEEPAPARSPRDEEARRYARLIATDIRLYHEEAVLVGRRNRDLRRRLGDQMDRGRESFARRFSDLGGAGSRMLEDAYVEVLAAGDEALIRPAVGSGPGID